MQKMRKKFRDGKDRETRFERPLDACPQDSTVGFYLGPYGGPRG